METKHENKSSAEIAATVRSITASVCLRCVASRQNLIGCQGYDMLRALECLRRMLRADERT